MRLPTHLPSLARCGGVVHVGRRPCTAAPAAIPTTPDRSRAVPGWVSLPRLTVIGYGQRAARAGNARGGFAGGHHYAAAASVASGLPDPARHVVDTRRKAPSTSAGTSRSRHRRRSQTACAVHQWTCIAVTNYRNCWWQWIIWGDEPRIYSLGGQVVDKRKIDFGLGYVVHEVGKQELRRQSHQFDDLLVCEACLAHHV